MDEKIGKLLQLPFDANELDPPGKGREFGFFNAQPLTGISIDPAHLFCAQSDRARYLSLDRAGYEVKPDTVPQELAGALLVCSKHKLQNEHNFFEAWNACRSQSTLIVAGLKKEGIASFKKLAARFAPIEGQISKYHGLVFWLRKPANPEMLETPEMPGVEGFETGPGVFSAAKIDRGSRLLTEHFSPKIQGNVTDLGAGWGYLSCQLREKTNSVRQLDLYESNWIALQSARKNVRSDSVGIKTTFNWTDLLQEAPTRKYNWVIMNPPFHTGVKGDPDLGKQFIEVSHKLLSPLGQLLMVANQHLPYETTIRRLYSQMECLEVREGFKVLWARK